ncbi:phenylacetate--CoA ligase family protein [Halosolutus halophilus]|uniref:phenylacetate--CoA ligase family protein n=1 Tax=Halosolutus halophilus TaxID=1552990 RepID=UPI00223527A3|nr:phenylacetate--CoA ligase family protein [Halosolutus halophilus]
MPENLQTIRRLNLADSEEIEQYQRRRLTDLLYHAHQTVPYYAEILTEAGVVVDGDVHLENFTEIPLLTKETLRRQQDRLVSRDHGPNPYTNTSGGTTGEPVEFVQDQRYWEWNVATKIFYQELAGKPLGGREIKLWGSERDLLEGTESLKTQVRNFLYNRRLLNSFRMSEEDMYEYVEIINSFQPLTIWAYVESIYQLARFVERNDLEVYAPEGIVTTAGTLHEPVRERVEETFDTRVHNQYGSREVGDVACECSKQDGLHAFPYSHYVEVLDEDGQQAPAGEIGRIVITNLTNYSMPLIRYEIGDMGVASADQCQCGSPFPLLESITGRVSDHLVSVDGELVHGEFFTHLFYGRTWIQKFQVRQVAPEKVVIRIVERDDEVKQDGQLTEIVEKIRMVMGESVTVKVEFTEEITPSSSGKYRYVISEVTE